MEPGIIRTMTDVLYSNPNNDGHEGETANSNGPCGDGLTFTLSGAHSSLSNIIVITLPYLDGSA
jgi:hypothetical protein